ncbi:uncharacterized protein [Diabrotica undecimpunctata]|uniref:uncharacterized protein n=1 Tax=Diabrotica undecimpunctata TaxID=50387 RepID=UPI003B63F34B
MEWSKENVFEFLHFYEEESIIWNAGHNDHKNRNLTHDAWKRIEINMGGRYSVDELKKKKDSLMSSFRFCHNKVKESTKSGAGTDDVYKPSWFAYEKMASFLTNRNKASVTIKSEDLWTSVDDQSSEENDPFEITPDDINVVDEKIVIEEMLPSTAKTYFKPPLQKKMKIPEENDLENKMDETFAIIQSYAEKKGTQKDYCDKYGEIVAERLRQLNERTRDIAINKIDNLLFELKMNQITSVQCEKNIPTNQN